MSFKMPAEWMPHRATWISWPHEESDWPGKFAPINWVYVEIVRLLAASEHVEIICLDQQQADQVEHDLNINGITQSFTIHILKTDRSWLRDSAPTAVFDDVQRLHWINWDFNAWAKYDNYKNDLKVPALISQLTKADLIKAERPDTNTRIVLEGGAIEVNGAGTLLTTEECLLSEIQQRNPGLTKEGYLAVLSKYLGIEKIIWLDSSCAGDDTHGHIDDVARFVNEHTVVLAAADENDPDNLASTRKNRLILNSATDAYDRALEVIELPMPRPIYFDQQRLPASYANFYIANHAVLVPTFNDKNDQRALSILSELFSDREVIGVHCLDLVLGLGTLHCLTQQEPK